MGAPCTCNIMFFIDLLTVLENLLTLNYRMSDYRRSKVLRIPATKDSKISIQMTPPGMNVKRPTPLRIQTNKVMPKTVQKMRVDNRN